MSDISADPTIAALAPAVAILESGRQDALDDSGPAAVSELLASIEAAVDTMPTTLSGAAAVLASLNVVMPWDDLVTDDGRTLNVSLDDLTRFGGILYRALHRLSVVLSQYGGIAPLPLVNYALKPDEANIIAGRAAKLDVAAPRPRTDSDAEEAPHAPETPEIECIYARWVRARGDMLMAAADTDVLIDDASDEANGRMDREAWAMVGTRAHRPHQIRHKIEAIRDNLSVGTGTMRLDGLELALLNSIDVDLAATD